MLRVSLAITLLFLLAGAANAQKKKSFANAAEEDKYYKLLSFEAPKGEVLEAGAIEMLPDGKVAIGTRRGEIWMIDYALDPDPKKVVLGVLA